ncbi:MAG: hypothetical protein L3J66_00570 [Bacteroidales bacterium]|nr:hypothetical protein [Bacteroidales bacterium]
MKKKKNILVCPLDWGLGHATRMVPVVEMLEQKGAHVVIAADKRPLAFLRQRFPRTAYVRFPGFVPAYPEKGPMAWSMAKSFPRMLREAKKANALLQEMVAAKKIDLIISDNRYEMYSQKVPSVFVTHQLNIQTAGWQKLANPLINKTINGYISNYRELWVPDLPGEESLSGRLSHPVKIPTDNVHFIGHLSRFSNVQAKNPAEPVELLILISGPEPQRSLLEEMLTKQALLSKRKTIILQGKPEAKGTLKIKNVQIIPHLPDPKLAALIQTAEIVVSRPGYSTLMDLAVFGKKAVFIPTPGQTEQEYLARRLFKQGIAFSEKQNEFNLAGALRKAKEFSGLAQSKHSATLENRINLLLA